MSSNYPPAHKRRCDNCLYWWAGECRRHAPLPLTGAQGEAKWPDTQADDKCGEWAPVEVRA